MKLKLEDKFICTNPYPCNICTNHTLIIAVFMPVPSQWGAFSPNAIGVSYFVALTYLAQAGYTCSKWIHWAFASGRKVTFRIRCESFMTKTVIHRQG